jgi:hypothetical protein
VASGAAVAAEEVVLVAAVAEVGTNNQYA